MIYVNIFRLQKKTTVTFIDWNGQERTAPVLSARRMHESDDMAELTVQRDARRTYTINPRDVTGIRYSG